MRGYTIAQVQAFVDAISRAHGRRRIEAIADARAAQASKKDCERHLAEIER